MQALMGVTSVDTDDKVAGNVVAAEYVPVHPESEGLVIQALIGVTSVESVDTVDGNDVAAEYVPVQPASDGFVKQALIGVTSVDKDVTTAGRVVAAEYVPVQPEDDGSVKHDLTVVMSVDNVDTDAILTGMELLELYFAVQVEAVLSSIQAKIIFKFGIKGVVDLNCCLYEFFLFFFFVSFVLSPLLALKMFLKRSDGCGPKFSLISTSASKARSFLNLAEGQSAELISAKQLLTFVTFSVFEVTEV